MPAVPGVKASEIDQPEDPDLEYFALTPFGRVEGRLATGWFYRLIED